MLPNQIMFRFSQDFNVHKFRSVCLSALIVLGWCRVAVGATDASLTAQLDRQTISLGESATLTLTFQNASPQRIPQMPNIPGLTLRYGGQYSETQIVNGQRIDRFSIRYTVTPTRVGTLTIPALQVIAGSQPLTSQPVTLKVVATAPAPANAANGGPFLKLVPTKRRLYLGEALPVEVQLYAQEGRLSQPPQFKEEGFTIGKFTDPSKSQTILENRRYNIVTFRTYVSPAKPGRLELGPATMPLTVPRPNARRNIFGEIVDWQQVNLTSNPASLEVLPLPADNVPPTFNGAVGKFALTFNAGPTNLVAGDPITANIRISGSGLIDHLNLPPQPQWNGFKTYPPTAKTETRDPLGLSGAKSFEQVVIPESEQITHLPPFAFSYFDPEAGEYRTLRGPDIPLQVAASQSVALPPALKTNAPPGPAEELLHIKTRLGNVVVPEAPLIYRPWFLLLQGLPVVFWAGCFVRRKRAEFLDNHPSRRRQRQVAQTVRQGLAELPHLAETHQEEGFFALVFRLLQEQIGERLGVAASSITEAVIEERLRGHGLSEEILSELHELFQECNQARYAGHRTSQELGSVRARLTAVLTDLQKWNP